MPHIATGHRPRVSTLYMGLFLFVCMGSLFVGLRHLAVLKQNRSDVSSILCLSEEQSLFDRLQACSLAIELVQNSKNQIELRKKRSSLALAAGQREVVRGDLDWLVEHQPSNFENHLNLALQIGNSEPRTTNLRYRDALRLAPTDKKDAVREVFSAHLGQASQQLAKTGDFKGALAFADLALGLYPSDAEKVHRSLSYRGRLHFRSGDISAAL